MPSNLDDIEATAVRLAGVVNRAADDLNQLVQEIRAYARQRHEQQEGHDGRQP